jgi:hypothetical protein
MSITNEFDYELTTSNELPIRYQCRHIFADGHRCASPSLRHEDFCYYHHTTRRPVPVADQRRRRANVARHTPFDLPLADPTDRSAIQLTLLDTLRRLAANNIDPRRASLLLYGLQIVSSNLPRPTAASGKRSASRNEDGMVEDITHDPTLGPLAPRADFNQADTRPSLAAYLIAELRKKPVPCAEDREDLTTRPSLDTNPQPATENKQTAPAIIPEIQATAVALSQTQKRRTVNLCAVSCKQQPLDLRLRSQFHKRSRLRSPIRQHRFGQAALREPRMFLQQRLQRSLRLLIDRT